MSRKLAPEGDVIDIDQFDPAVITAAQAQEYEKTVEQTDELRAYVARRKRAYAAVFKRGDSDVEFVLNDLAAFSRAYQSRFNLNERVQNVLEGRAEVYYRIVDYTRQDNDTLYLKLTAARVKQEKE